MSEPLSSLFTLAPSVWLVPVVVAGAIFLAAFAFVRHMNEAAAPLKRRLKDIAGEREKTNGLDAARVAARIEGLRPMLMPKRAEETSRIHAKLVQAGLRNPNAVLLFFALKALLALLAPAMLVVVASWTAWIGLDSLLFYVMMAAAVGVFSPNAVVAHLVTRRQEQLRRGFPDALDLMVVCVEAGLGFDLAIKRIADEMQGSHPLLAAEFAMVSAEIRAGVDRLKALRNLAARTGLDDVHGFVGLLAQSLRFGTSIGDTLRIYAEDFRDKRMQKAEEMAAKVGTKMIFPMVLCFFPSFFIVATGPIILKVSAVLQ